MLEAVKQDGSALQFADESLTKDREIVLDGHIQHEVISASEVLLDMITNDARGSMPAVSCQT